MTTKLTILQQDYTELIGHITSMFNLSVHQIKEKYADYPTLTDNFEKDEEAIEIRFDKHHVTVNCHFNKFCFLKTDQKCIRVTVFPDDNQFIKDIAKYLKRNYTYNFFKRRFNLGDFFMKVTKSEELEDIIYLLFYLKE